MQTAVYSFQMTDDDFIIVRPACMGLCEYKADPDFHMIPLKVQKAIS